MKKMNNKGFSLVELIVVVLIMAIIAVALAPQVMRWVENSRKSNDIESYNALLEACNVAATDEKVIAKVTGTKASPQTVATMKSKAKGGTSVTGTEWQTAVARTMDVSECYITSGDWEGNTYEVKAYKEDGGVKVVKGNAPEKDFS
jgi:prepilin-type N-terminal cleavage/methylation domain-containing protein